MKKPYIYNFVVWLFHENQRAFIAWFLIAAALIVVPNQTLRWLGITFMFLFIILAIAGGVDYFIFKMREKNQTK
jgi:hypothetical protein